MQFLCTRLLLFQHVQMYARDYSVIRTVLECFAPKLAEGLPDLCWSVFPGSGELICIKRGESGYYPSDWENDDPIRNRETADYATKATLAGVEFRIPYADGRFVEAANGRLNSNGHYTTNCYGEIRIYGITGAVVVTEEKTLPGYSETQT